MKEIRCPSYKDGKICKRLLFKASGDNFIEMKCPLCKLIIRINLKTLYEIGVVEHECKK